MKKLFIYSLFLFLFAGTICAANDKKVYLVDVSGSMIGEGSVATVDIFQSVLDELKNAVASMGDNTDIVIIPFAENTYPAIRATSKDKDTLIKQIDNIKIRGKLTNIDAAYTAALKELDTLVETSVFFITDGYHNIGIDTTSLFSKLNDYPRTKAASSCALYYLLCAPQYRGMTICDIFARNERMELIETLALSAGNSDTSTKTKEDVCINNATIDTTNNSTFNLRWWMVLLVLLIIGIIYLLIRFVIPSISKNSQSFGNLAGITDTMAPGLSRSSIPIKIQDNINILNDKKYSPPEKLAALKSFDEELHKLPQEEQDKIYNNLGKNEQTALEKYWESNPLPRNNGHWDGQPGNSNWIPDKNYVPLNKTYNNMDGKTMGQIMSENGVLKIPYKNGYLDASSIAKYSVKIDYRELGKDGLNKLVKEKDREQLHELAFKKLSEKLNMPIEEVKDMKNKLRLVWHEDPDLKTLYLVPREIHDNLSHSGGIKLISCIADFL